MATSQGLDRVLISELDSLAQAHAFSRLSAADAVEDLSAILRLGALVSSQVIVTDSMLLDGAFFLVLGPYGVAGQMGVGAGRLPLVITSRSASLREALDHKRASPGFEWVAPRALGVESVDDLDRMQRRWIEAAERGLVAFETQHPAGIVWTLDAHTIGDPVADALLARLAATSVRSEARALLESSGASPEHVAAASMWWNRAYFRFLARNARADWISVDDDDRRISEGIPIPARLVEWARASSPATFAVAWDSTVGHRSRLRRDPRWRRMRDLAFAAMESTRPHSRRRVIGAAVATSVVAVGALLFAVPGWQQSALDHPLTWGAFAVAVLSTFPLEALRSLLSLLRPDPRAVLVVDRSGDG